MGEMEQKLDFIENEFLKDRVIFFETEFDEFECNSVKKKILYLYKKDPKLPITIYINSFGGSADDFLMIYGLLQRAPCKIITIVTGYAYSAGADLLMCGDERYAYPGSRIMFHELSLGIAYDKLHEQEHNIKEARKINEIITELMKKTKIKNIADYLKEDRYMGVEEALHLGVLTKKI
jgi:ATP-dependent Clp protease protease subunit